MSNRSIVQFETSVRINFEQLTFEKLLRMQLSTVLIIRLKKLVNCFPFEITIYYSSFLRDKNTNKNVIKIVNRRVENPSYSRSKQKVVFSYYCKNMFINPENF